MRDRNREYKREILTAFSLNAANFLITYYLPIYFQAIDGVSPTDSGIRNLPLILGVCKSFATEVPFFITTHSALSTLRDFKWRPGWPGRVLSAISRCRRNIRHRRRWPPLHARY